MWARLKLIFNIKKAKTRVVLLLFVTFLGLLISAFFTREEILEWRVVNFASEQGLQKFSLNVEDIDFRESSFSDLKGSNDALSFAINEVELRYNPKEIVNKKIQALSISGLNANFNIVDKKSDSNQSELTPGQLYYVQTDGTISTTAGSPSVVAGIGLSATELLVTKS